MIWKIIGKNVKGTSHAQSGKDCEDAVSYCMLNLPDTSEILVCCVCDGAGSARFAKDASVLVSEFIVSAFAKQIRQEVEIDDVIIRQILETAFDKLSVLAEESNSPISEYSCTCLAAIVFEHKAIFLQIGDGVIVREDGSGSYTPVFWPYNGEYLNSTAFLVDDINFPFLKILCVGESIDEIALMTERLQNLTLNNESQGVHQPFFNDLFKWLRMAKQPEHVAVLQSKLESYLDSPVINNRTDDDKTLLLATRFKS